MCFLWFLLLVFVGLCIYYILCVCVCESDCVWNIEIQKENRKSHELKYKYIYF